MTSNCRLLIPALICVSTCWILPAKALTVSTTHSLNLPESPVSTPSISEIERLSKKARDLGRNQRHREAIIIYETVISLRRQMNDPLKLANALSTIGVFYSKAERYLEAHVAYKEALNISKAISNIGLEAKILNNIGLLYNSMAQYDQALIVYHQSLKINQTLEDLDEQGNVLDNIGDIYSATGQYFKSLDYYQKGLVIRQKLTDRKKEAISLTSVGEAHLLLGQYPQAFQYFQTALKVLETVNDLPVQATLFRAIGNYHQKQGQYNKAVSFYQQTVSLFKQADRRIFEGQSLSSLGEAYLFLKQNDQALESLTKALRIAREIDDRASEGRTLDRLGLLAEQQGTPKQAFRFYQQSLSISQSIGDRNGERITLSHLGHLWSKQNKPDLAIIFYKQSVNVTESIRKEIQELPKEQQTSYTHVVSQTYRQLADLLIQQGRLSEAQQVLELLKIQEINEFTRGEIEVNRDIPLLALEKQILQQYGSLTAFGQTLYQCEQKGGPCTDLRDQLDQLDSEFTRQSNTLIKTLRERLASDPGLIAIDQIHHTATNIVTAEPGTILIYPVINNKNIWLLMAVRAGEKGIVLRSQEINSVGQQELWKAVSRFRELLQDPNSNPKELQQVSAKLYDWLIRPLDSELKNSQINNLVFALDRSTRYIPMGALYDQQTNQYLIQKYAVSTILAAELTDTRDRLPRQSKDISILGLGVSKSTLGFSALPNVPQELDSIIQTPAKPQGLYRGTLFLDEAFDFTSFRDNLHNQQIVHIATHGQFEPGHPENSFILPGKGNRLTITQIQKLRNYMRDVHLVVLSACQTAVGGPDESGMEIPGISFYFLKNNVKSVLASLWQVNDASTSQLMQQFYQNLSKGNLTKAEALRQAQLTLIGKNTTTSEALRGSIKFPSSDGSKTAIDRNLSHPYYWAPFILIGNGL